MAYLGTKPANQVIDSTLIADGTITPADLSTGKPVWDTSGNLGVGTSSPVFKVDVNGPSGNGLRYFDGAVSNVIGTSASGGFIGTTTNHFLAFAINGAERVRIDTNGSVGIGTSNPNMNSSGAVCHINSSLTNGWATTHYTNGTTGSASGDGFLVGTLDTSGAYLFNYENSPMVFATNSVERMMITGDTGRLLVGTGNQAFSGVVARQTISYTGASSEYGLGFRPALDNTVPIWFSNAAGSGVGSIATYASSTAYNTSSDYRLKENIAPMTGALNVIQQLKPVTYNWKVDGSSGQGFIAHELQAVVPDCVTGEKDAVDAEGKPIYQGIDTSFLVATLTAAIQELKAELDTVKSELQALKG